MKGGKRCLETWTYLKKKLEAQLGGPSGSVPPPWKLGSFEEKGWFVSNPWIGMEISHLGLLLFLPGRRKPCNMALVFPLLILAPVQHKGPPCPNTTGTGNHSPSWLKFHSSEVGSGRGTEPGYLSKPPRVPNQRSIRKIFVSAYCQPSVFHHDNIQLFLF